MLEGARERGKVGKALAKPKSLSHPAFTFCRCAPWETGQDGPMVWPSKQQFVCSGVREPACLLCPLLCHPPLTPLLVFLVPKELSVEISWLARRRLVQEGDSFTLRCQTVGQRPVLRYIWAHGNEWLQEAGQELHIPHAGVTDGGCFSCSVWVSGPNSGLLVSTRKSITVHCKLWRLGAPASSRNKAQLGVPLPSHCSPGWGMGEKTTLPHVSPSSCPGPLDLLSLSFPTIFNLPSCFSIFPSDAPTSASISPPLRTTPQDGESVMLAHHYTRGIPRHVTYT